MQILAIDRILPGVTYEQIAPYLKEEAMAAWNLYKSGKARELFFRGDRAGAVLMLTYNSIEEAKADMDRLPLVAHKLIEFDLIPLTPFTPFEQLFAK